MRIVMFYHSLVSDWNHGNAHFLRGIASELLMRGHKVVVYEPRDGWSRRNLVAEHGEPALRWFKQAYPKLKSIPYSLHTLRFDEALDGAHLVIVHEWNDPKLVKTLGGHRARGGKFKLLFHDTHHRSATDPKAMAKFDLSRYDGVLAFGDVVRKLYLQRRWAKRAWTWHEGADVHLFQPLPNGAPVGDLVWIGNWGDEERTRELHEFLIEPVRELHLKARCYGVRYPDDAQSALQQSGIEYAGWLPNFAVPGVYAKHRFTVHIPRRPYATALPGIPTIRVFEALACGMPLVCAPWQDTEELFTAGKDYLVATNTREMAKALQALRDDQELARTLGEHGQQTILARHTCAHRVDELLRIYRELAA